MTGDRTKAFLLSLVTCHYFLGDGEAVPAVFAAVLPLCGEACVAGLVAAAGGAEVTGLALAAGDDWPPAGAGRKPLRLLGLLSIFLARLLTIFASFIAVARSAAFKSDRRWLMSASLI